MHSVKIYTVANGLGHGDALFHGMLFQPLYLFGMDLNLGSDHDVFDIV